MSGSRALAAMHLSFVGAAPSKRCICLLWEPRPRSDAFAFCGSRALEAMHLPFVGAAPSRRWALIKEPTQAIGWTIATLHLFAHATV